MNVNVKYLENQYCAPKDHPITCANPAPWKITEVKITCQEKVFVRGKGSMWFRLDQCILDTKETLEEWIEYKEEQKKEKFDIKNKIAGYFENLPEEIYKELDLLVSEDIEEKEKQRKILTVLKEASKFN
jgi:hypothetical protein